MLEIGFWNRQVGLLPVNFLHNQSEGQRIYAMLNGSSHNFCIGYDQIGIEDVSFRNKVWSANMTSFLCVTPETVRLYDISRLNYEEISSTVIERDIRRFYSYLNTKSLRREDGVLEFILNRFKEIRSVLREKDGARQSLSILLYILSQLDGADNINWKLPENVEESINTFTRDNLEVISTQLREGLRDLGFRPNTDMILRHCSGALFQEANFIAHFPPQLSLFPSISYSAEKNPNLVGAYFTPSYIARTIVEESLKHINLSQDQLTIFDPACGSGVFLSECLRQLKTRKYQGKIYVLGWDIEQIAIDMSNYVLSFEQKEWGNQLSYTIEKRNSLSTENIWPVCDLILMNPPYISWAYMDEEQRRLTTELFGGTSCRPNLSVAFYYKASRALTEHGVIGSLMPSAFLQLEKIADIRQELCRTVPPVFVGQLGNYVFSSALVDVSIIVSQRNAIHGQTQYLWTRNSNKVSEEALRALRISNAMERPQSSEDYNIYLGSTERSIENDSWVPMSIESIELSEMLAWRLRQRALISVMDLFEVKQGARTGANKVFILSQEEYSRLPIRERIFFRPSIDNDAINNGRLEETNYMFYPYPTEEKGFINEDDLSRKMPHYYYEYLLPNKEKLRVRSKIDENKWWLLSWPRAWQFVNRPKLISTEFGKAGSYSIDVKGNFVVERGLCWFPKNLKMSMSELYFYIAILNSEFYNELLMLYSKQLAGGVFNLETKHVNSIPMPIYNQVPDNIREALSQYGKYMLAGVRYKESQLYELVRQIYV